LHAAQAADLEVFVGRRPAAQVGCLRRRAQLVVDVDVDVAESSFGLARHDQRIVVGAIGVDRGLFFAGGDVVATHFPQAGEQDRALHRVAGQLGFQVGHVDDIVRDQRARHVGVDAHLAAADDDLGGVRLVGQAAHRERHVVDRGERLVVDGAVELAVDIDIDDAGPAKAVEEDRERIAPENHHRPVAAPGAMRLGIGLEAGVGVIGRRVVERPVAALVADRAAGHGARIVVIVVVVFQVGDALGVEIAHLDIVDVERLVFAPVVELGLDHDAMAKAAIQAADDIGLVEHAGQ